VEAIKGIGAACDALSYPVISGNVSLYNETEGTPILPTPAIGGVGLVDNLDRMMTIAFKRAGEAVLLIGQPDGEGWLGQSLYLRELGGQEAGAPPPVDLAHERKVGDAVRALIVDDKITACHDIADGGLLVAVTEMALAGKIGATLKDFAAQTDILFGEDQGRYVVTAPVELAATIVADLKKAGVAAQQIGTTGGTTIALGSDTIELAALRQLHEDWFPTYMAAAS
jgi:phosphoribosylformylglycinamidine synthase